MELRALSLQTYTISAQWSTRIRFLIDKTRLLDRLRGQISERQEKALLRIFREGLDGFAGGLSAGNYRSITVASLATATRDLNVLVEKGALIRTGERRYARYRIAIDVSVDRFVPFASTHTAIIQSSTVARRLPKL